MPFDLNGLFETIQIGASKIPSAVMAALLLGGPTAIWLITKFVNPTDFVKPVEVVTEDRLWLCGSCLSINEDRHDQCYRCHHPREAESVPVVIHGGHEGMPRIGVAIGPSLAEPHAPTSWLGGEFTVTALPTRTRGRSATATIAEPVAMPAPVAMPKPPTVPRPATMQEEPPPHSEPKILEPRVKVSTRASGSKSANRRQRKPQGAGEAN